jgi:hypothetical protein
MIMAKRTKRTSTTKRSPTTNPSKAAENGQPVPDGRNTPAAPDPADREAQRPSPDADSAAFLFGANAEPDPSTKRPLIPGIDLDSVALEENYADDLMVEEAPLTVVVGKPSGKGYFRAHPELFKNVRMLEIKNGADRGFYLVAAGARALLQSEEHDDIVLFPARLTLCLSRDSGLFLWPLRLPEQRRANQIDEWSQAALRIVKLAETQWVKLYTPRGASCYSHKIGKGIKSEPSWPSLSLNELAGLAFEGKYLTDPEDPLIRRLLGKE